MASRTLQVNIVGDPSSFSRAMRKVGRDADDANKRIQFFSDGADSAGSAFGGLSARVGAFGGSLSTLAPVVAVATPALLALGGAAAAVAGSMAAAAGGAAALGTGLAASLAPVLVVGKQVSSRFGEIKKAYDLVQTAQREGTAAAKKNADQALANLSKAERAMVGSFGRISKLQRTVLGGASDRIIGALSGAINRVAPSLEKLARPFDRLGGAIAGVITKASRSLAGSEWSGALRRFVESARRLVGPISRIFGSIANIMRDVATASLPLVQGAVREVARWFGRLDRAATTSKIRGVVRDLVGHTQSWWNLTKEVGKLLFSVFNTGAKDGKSLVDSLTGVVRQWNRWLGTEAGQRKMRDFIKDSVKTVRELARIVGFFGGAAIKASVMAINAFEKIRPALRLVTRGLTPIVRLLTGDFSGAWRAAKNNAIMSVTAIRNAAVGLIDTMRRVSIRITAAIIKGLGNLGNSIFAKIKSGVTSAAEQAGKWIDKANPFSGITGNLAGDVAKGFNDSFGGTLGGGALGGFQTAGLQVEAKQGLSFIQSHFGNVRVSSGWRSRQENAAVGGAPNSDHLKGLALDLVPSEGWTSAGTRRLDRIAAWARTSPLIRWIGWRGVPGHGPGDHLHLSFFDRVAGDVAMVGGKLKAFGGKVRGAGDVIGLGGLANLWRRAGGPGNIAALMAHIAVAESGGDTNARNPSGAAGLWQILGQEVPGNLFDPSVNARNAVWKYRHQGLGAWAASRGEWGRYLGASGAGGRRSGTGRPARPRIPVGTVGAHHTGGLPPGTAGPSPGEVGAQSLSDIELAKAEAQAHDDLPGFIRALQFEKRVVRRRIKHLRRYLKRRRIKPANRQKFTDELTTLVGTLADINANLKEYRADAAGGATTISAAEGLTAGVAPEGSHLGPGGTAVVADAEAGPTPADFADLAVAEAALTPGTGDDLAALNSLLGIRQGELNAARATGDPRKILEALSAWSEVKTAIDNLKEAVTTETETRQRLIDEIKGLKDEVRKQNDFSRSVAGIASREAVRALADVISGQIVGVNLQGRRQTAGNGTLAFTP